MVEGVSQLTQTAPDLHTVHTYTDTYITNEITFLILKRQS